MRSRLLFLLLCFVFPALSAQEKADGLLPHEISVNAGFLGSVRQSRPSFGGGMYSFEYARFYPHRIGFRTGISYHRNEYSDYNTGFPMYFAYRTRISAGKHNFNEEDSFLSALLSLFPSRLEFNAGIRPGWTNIDPSGRRRPKSIENRFSCALHLGMRASFCFGRVEVSFIPAYDYYLTSDFEYDHTIYGSFLSVNGGLTFRLKK